MRLKLNVGPVSVLWELIKVKLNLRKISMEGILASPSMKDEARLCCYDLLLSIGTPAYFFNPYLFALIELRGINESLRHGLPNHAAVTFVSLATILENVLGDYDLGYKMGQMALQLDRQMRTPKLSGMVHHIFAHFIQHWNRHAKYDLEIYRKVYRLCLNHGDYIYAGHSINTSTDCRLCIGDPLENVLADAEKYKTFIDQVKDPWIGGIYPQHIRIIRTLLGLSPTAGFLAGQDEDEADLLAKLQADNHMYGLCFLLVPKIRLLYLFGRYEDALLGAEEVERNIRAPWAP